MTKGWGVRDAAWAASHRVMGLLIMVVNAFTAVVVLSWVIGLVVDYLKSIHPFHSDALRHIEVMEVGVLYVFTFVCGIAVTIGVFRMFFRQVRG